MNCYNHPDRAAASFCRACGRALCTVCQRPAEGTVFCPEHLPISAQNSSSSAYSGAYATGGATGSYSGGPNPYAQGPQPPFTAAPVAAIPVQTSPGLAFLLGIIPGVGAIYNGQYIKGLVHAGIFGLLISLISSNEGSGAAPFFGILVATFVFYMPFEAYHTAKRRQAGMPVEEWSSLSRGPLPVTGGRTPVGPIILIGVGVLFLLDTMNLIEFRQIGRFWPVILISVGVSMLYSRMTPGRSAGPSGYVPGGYGQAAYPPSGSKVPPEQPSGAAPAGTPAAATNTGSAVMETGHE